MTEVSISEIREWQRCPVGELFFNILRERLERTDSQIHRYLERYTHDDLYQAALENAALTELQSVLDLPDDMVESLLMDEGEKNG